MKSTRASQRSSPAAFAASSWPLMDGMTVSVRGGSGRVSPRSSRARAASPSHASRTAYPCCSSTLQTSPRTVSSSSTTRTVSEPPDVSAALWGRGRGAIELPIPRLDRDPAAVGHRVPGVQGEVDDHLRELPGVRQHAPELRVERTDELAVLAQKATQRDPPDVGPEAIGLAELGEHEIAVPLDRRQEVVEVVGDPAGEPADGLQLLRLAEPGPAPRAP